MNIHPILDRYTKVVTNIASSTTIENLDVCANMITTFSAWLSQYKRKDHYEWVAKLNAVLYARKVELFGTTEIEPLDECEKVDVFNITDHPTN